MSCIFWLFSLADHGERKDDQEGPAEKEAGVDEMFGQSENEKELVTRRRESV
jgi:hypothetical protein